MATPFVPSEGDDPTTDLPSPDVFGKLQDEWNTFLGKPEGQAALLSFGINMLQPPSFGDNPVAQAGRALGHAGETVGNIEKMDIAQQEAQSKEALRGSTAELQAEKISHLGDTAAAQAERNRLLQENAQQRMGLGRTQAQLKLQAMYQQEKLRLDTLNEARAKDVLNAPGSPGYRPPAPIPSYSEWIVTDPIARATAAEAGINVDLAPSKTAPTTTPASPTKVIRYDKAGNPIP